MYPASQVRPVSRTAAATVDDVSRRTPLPADVVAPFRWMEYGRPRPMPRPAVRAARGGMFGRRRTAVVTRQRACGLGSCSFTAKASRRQAIVLTHWRAATAVFAVRARVA